MKNFSIVLYTIVFIAFLGCAQSGPEEQHPIMPPVDQIGEWLGTLPGVHSVRELKSKNYKKSYVILFNQMIDPKNPAAGTFLQRVFLSHQDFDNPVIFDTNGYDAEWRMTATYWSELTKRYNANVVEVEHRYSGLSFPSLSDWKHLSSENAASDRSYFVGKANMMIFIQDAGSHAASIEYLSSSDKQQTWTKLDSWVL